MALLNDYKPDLISRKEAEGEAREILDNLEPGNYPQILALPREAAVRRIVDSAAVSKNQYERGYLTNAVLTIEADLSH